MSRDLYLASGNAHKFDEIVELLQSHELYFNLYTPQMLGPVAEVEETADTFEGNALLKARSLESKVFKGGFILSDDSGLIVDALDGAPGVLSARYAGEKASAEENNAKLLSSLEGVPEEDRTASFICVLVLLRVGEEPMVFEGKCAGSIVDSVKGSEGFGYDPVFRPEGYQDTFGQLGESVKQKISHRAKAFEKLATYLSTVPEE